MDNCQNNFPKAAYVLKMKNEKNYPKFILILPAIYCFATIKSQDVKGNGKEGNSVKNMFLKGKILLFRRKCCPCRADLFPKEGLWAQESKQ